MAAFDSLTLRVTRMTSRVRIGGQRVLIGAGRSCSRGGSVLGSRGGVVAVVVLLAVASCASPDRGSVARDSTEERPPGLADCSDQWVQGRRLPVTYEGCLLGNGDPVPADSQPCESGDSTFVVYDHRYFALLGGQVTQASDSSSAYNLAFAKCFPHR